MGNSRENINILKVKIKIEFLKEFLQNFSSMKAKFLTQKLSFC